MSEEEGGTKIGGSAVSETATFGARQSEKFLKIIALTPFLNLGWILSQGEQVRTWNTKTENARSEVVVESAPITLFTYIFALQVSILNHLQKYFLSIFCFMRLVITRCSYSQES